MAVNTYFNCHFFYFPKPQKVNFLIYTVYKFTPCCFNFANRIIFAVNCSSGQGEIPDRRLKSASPIAVDKAVKGLSRCNSGTDSYSLDGRRTNHW